MKPFKILLPVLLATSFTSAAAAVATMAAPVSIEARYSFTLAGVSVGTGKISAVIDDDRYTVKGKASSNWLTARLGKVSIDMRSRGFLRFGKIRPSSFILEAKDRRKITNIYLAMSNGDINRRNISPKPGKRPDRIAMRDSDMRNVVDPVSSFLLSSTNASSPDEYCHQTVRINDGYRRHDIRFRHVETKMISLGTYHGPAYVCSARFIPIAGHRSLKREIRYFAENRDMSAWIVPIADTGYLGILRLSAMTPLGRAVMEPVEFRIRQAD